MDSLPADAPEAASPEESPTREFVNSVAELVRVEQQDEARSEDAASTLEQLVAAVNCATAWVKRDQRFPQDCAEGESQQVRAGPRSVPSYLPNLPAGAVKHVDLDACWLSYGCETVLREHIDGAATEHGESAARALGLLVRALEEVDSLWRAMPEPRAVNMPPYLLTAVAAADCAPEPALRLAWSSRLGPVPDGLTLRRALASPQIHDKLRERLSRWADAARSLPVSDRGRAIIDGLVRRLLEHGQASLAASWLWRMVPGGWDALRVRGERERTVRLAQVALLADERLQEAWEVQRWGGWCEEPRIGRLLPVGLCLLALAESGANVSAAAAELLSSEASVDGFRYYGRWRGIPPDSDDLGLALQLLALAGDTPERRRAFERPIKVLLHNTQPDGWIPIWLEEGLLEPTTPDGPYWLIRRCSAAVISALIGLLQTDWPLPARWRDRVLGRLIEVLRHEGLASVKAYPACYARLLLARLERALKGRDCPDTVRAALEHLLTEIERELLSSQQLDGGWGSPLATACHLAVLSLRQTPGFDPAPAILYLSARQQCDGLWPAEPLYECPGRDNAPQFYATRSVTTAICLEALVLAGRLPFAGDSLPAGGSGAHA